jgi:5-methyltetrahydropteroyltriglutamate--homocysteine methyltransferase
MQHSESRILTTHAGSLPRPKSLVALQLRRSRGEAVDRDELAEETAKATRRAVARQLGGSDGNDGEQRESFFLLRYRIRLWGRGPAVSP